MINVNRCRCQSSNDSPFRGMVTYEPVFLDIYHGSIQKMKTHIRSVSMSRRSRHRDVHRR